MVLRSERKEEGGSPVIKVGDQNLQKHMAEKDQGKEQSPEHGGGTAFLL